MKKIITNLHAVPTALKNYRGTHQKKSRRTETGNHRNNMDWSTLNPISIFNYPSH